MEERLLLSPTQAMLGWATRLRGEQKGNNVEFWCFLLPEIFEVSMASEQMKNRLNAVERDLSTVKMTPKFRSLMQVGEINSVFGEAEQLASTWLSRVKPLEESMSESALQHLAVFVEQIVGVVERRINNPGVTVANQLRQLIVVFKESLKELTPDLLDAAGLLDAGQLINRSKEEALLQIHGAVEGAQAAIGDLTVEATRSIKKDAEQAAEEYKLAKESSNRVAVGAAEAQFQEAGKKLRGSARLWLGITCLILAGLLAALFWFFYWPPEIIRYIEWAVEQRAKAVPVPVSAPLLVIAGAYFTAIRLAIIGVLGIALAVSLRMMRAYYHMAEHNAHRLRVTNSIEAFVAAVRTPEQKDFVLGKLVESVTEFGESGMLGGLSESQAWPSVVLESVTKNIGKHD